MRRYLISFKDGAMTFPEEDLPEVSRASREVVQQAKDAGVWIFGAGLNVHEVSVVATDGVVSDGVPPQSTARLGGFSIIEVPSPDEAKAWAARIAVACRCAQEVREIMFDPES
jgi:hypothetical protein